MRIPKHSLNHSTNAIAGRVVAFLALFALLASTFSLGVSAQRKATSQPTGLNEDQRILHVLNRLGFGARPGDVARVKAMGLDNYINQQLNPEKISDTVADAKVKDLTTLNMTTAELYEKFPQPGLLLRQLERRGELPDSTRRSARESRQRRQRMRLRNRTSATQWRCRPTGAARKRINDKPNENGDPRDNQKYRQALREYYRQNGLQHPQRIIG